MYDFLDFDCIQSQLSIYFYDYQICNYDIVLFFFINSAGILFDMPILPVSLTRLGPSSNTQGIQAQLGIQSLLHHSDSLQSSNPYSLVSSSGSANLGTSTGSLTILFGSPVERSIASYINTSIGLTSTTATVTGVSVLAAAAAAALATSNPRPTQAVTSVTSQSSSERSYTRSVFTSVSNVPSSTVSTMSTSTTETISTSSTATDTPALTVMSTEFTSSNTCNSVGSGSNYGLLDHRTLFKETHPVQSITISKSGTQALITIHKMVSLFGFCLYLILVF